MKRKDAIIGTKIGRLTILENVYLGGNGGSMVRVQCDCGKIYLASKKGVLTSKVTQCKECYCNSPKINNRRGVGELSGRYWGSVLCNARSRKIEVEITKEDAYDLFLKQNKRCALSGVEIWFDNYKERERTASLDRKDPCKSYILDNIQWVHKEINLMKQCLTNKELIIWCNLISFTQA